MRVAYELFQGEAVEGDLAIVAQEATAGSAAQFYANLYLGLYAEARKEPDVARNCG